MAQPGRHRCAVVRSLTLCVGALCFTRPALAEAPSPPYRLEYWAEGSCPTEREFAQRIETREPGLRRVDPGDAALGFFVEIRELPNGASGRLTARTEDGREVTREVRGPSCDDVASALALIAAFAVNPKPTERAPPTSAPPAAAARAPRHRNEDAAVAAEEDEHRWSFGVGVGVGFVSNIAPSPGYGLGAEFEAESPPGSVWRTLFALSAIRAASARTETRAGDASFTWLAFRGMACPVRWPQLTPLFVRPCAFAEAGLLEGNVALAGQSEDKTRSWFAAGGFGRIEALVDEVVSFQLDGGGTVALKRDSFDAGPGSESAFRVPALGLLGRIGVAYRFE